MFSFSGTRRRRHCFEARGPRDLEPGNLATRRGSGLLGACRDHCRGTSDYERRATIVTFPGTPILTHASGSALHTRAYVTTRQRPTLVKNPVSLRFDLTWDSHADYLRMSSFPPQDLIDTDILCSGLRREGATKTIRIFRPLATSHRRETCSRVLLFPPTPHATAMA